MAVTEGRRVLKGKMSARACWLGVNMKQAFDVAGMTCAACKARVEKATESVDGVAEVAVNLLKNSMEVTYADESPAGARNLPRRAAFLRPKLRERRRTKRRPKPRRPCAAA